MSKIVWVGIALVFIATCAGAEQKWQESIAGLNETEFHCIAVHPKTAGVIFAGSSRSLYKSVDGGKSWKQVLNIWSAKRRINFILIDEADSTVYAATENGLYQSLDNGASWKVVYRGQGDWKNVLALAKSGNKLYLGTKAGVVLHYDKVWQRLDSGLPQLETISVAADNSNPKIILVANTQGVFRSGDEAKTWEKVFVSSSEESEEAPQEADFYSDDTIQPNPRVRFIAIDKTNPARVFLATKEGVFNSTDAGKTFQPFTIVGLGDGAVNFILLKEQAIYVATTKGVFFYRQDRQIWQELYVGIIQPQSGSLAYDSSQAVTWLACLGGIFKLPDTPIDSASAIAESLDLSQEPTINQVQEMSIHYAEVDPNKIKAWRKRAKVKAVLPKLTVGIDRSKSSNYEIYTSAATSYVYEGPYDRSGGWDVTLSWELGDLIWNDAETSIDVRSRLMVQLRNDILDEVNRAYFERRRLQFELAAHPQGNLRLEKELRLQELTANLDALTGGWFSRNIK